MRHLFTSSFVILLFLMCCKNVQDENVNNSVDSGASIQKTDSEAYLKKQAPTYTTSELPYPFSSAIQVGDILFLSGEIGDAGQGTGVVPGRIVPETHLMFERIQATLFNHGFV